MNVALATIPHTGTHLVREWFRRLGYRQVALNERDERKSIRVGHISTGQMPHIRNNAKEYPLIVTLRHPFVTAEAWLRRDKPIGDMIQAYHYLFDEVAGLADYIIPIDAPSRDEAISRLNSGLGLEVVPDWTPQGVVANTHGLKWTELNPLPEVRELADAELIKQFYE